MSESRLKQHKLFFDIEKENEYVSEMNRLGWKLERVNFGWTYEFSRTNREEYTTVIFAEKSSKVSETTAFAKRCGFELIPHRFDGLKDVLYLCGRCDEVSPVFHNDSKSLMRAVESNAKDKGCAYLLLNVWWGNDGAIDFYRALGMSERSLRLDKKLD